MCGRYTLATPDHQAIRARFPVGESIEIRQRYNIAPTDEVLTVTTDKQGAPRGELLRWGLVPSWAKDPSIGSKLINARVETAAEKPAFRRAFEHYRCLIIADGFYEWRRTPGARKQPFHITRDDHEPFAFAGLMAVFIRRPRTLPDAAREGKNSFGDVRYDGPARRVARGHRVVRVDEIEGKDCSKPP